MKQPGQNNSIAASAKFRTAFWLYAALMVYLLFLQRLADRGGMSCQQWIQSSVNLIPGRTIGNFIRGAWNMWRRSGSTFLLRCALVNNLGNVIMLVPLGIFLPGLWRRQRRYGWFLLTVTGIILLVETIQLFTMLGSWDVDDVLLNVLGASIGFGLFQAWLRRQERKNAGS